MKNNYYVYQHVRLDTMEVFYVGKGTGNRAYSTKRRNKYWQNIVNKVGYHVEIVHAQLTEQKSFELEIETIANYRNIGYKLCNMTNGGEGSSGFMHSEESRAKIRAFNKGRVPLEETRAKMSAARDKKSVLNNFGEVYDSVTNAAIATGVDPSALSRCCLCKSKSAGTRNGEKIVWVFEEDRDTLARRVIEAIKASLGQPVKKVINNFGEMYTSIQEAAAVSGVNPSGISKCCLYKSKSAGNRNGEKIVWVFEEDKDNLEQRVTDANDDKTAKKVANNFGEVYDSAAEASRETGVDCSRISKCCRGKAKSAGSRDFVRLIWSFV